MLLIPYVLREREGHICVVAKTLVPKGTLAIELDPDFWWRLSPAALAHWPLDTQAQLLDSGYAVDEAQDVLAYPADDTRFVQVATDPVCVPTDETAHIYITVRDLQAGEVLTWDRPRYRKRS